MLSAIVFASAFGVLVNAPPCRPTHPAPRQPSKEGPSRSIGRPAAGSLKNATRIPEDGAYVKVLPARHRARRLNFAADSLAAALARAGEAVARRRPGAVLWIGNTAAPYGGSLAPYSVSHQTGLDADLAFYQYGRDGKVAAPEDLLALGDDGASFDGAYVLAVDLQWALVEALLSDPEIEVRYLLIYEPFKAKLLEYARATGADPRLIERAEKVMLQPRDAGPHRDHLHVRIMCPAGEPECEQ